MAGAKAFGEENPTQGEDAVSWATWSDGDGGAANVTGDADWGKLHLSETYTEGRSAVYDLGTEATRVFTLTENRYGTGAGSAFLQIRGSNTSFAQDDATPTWEDYSTPITRAWRYVQVRESFLPSLLSVSETNARYLVNESGTPVFLTGFHTWHSVQDGDNTDPPNALDWPAFVAAMTSRGLNFTKLWCHETGRGWSDITDYWFTPPRYERTGPGNDADGKLKFDLTQVNQDYLDRLRERAIYCRNRGIYVCVQLFDGWSIENKGMGGAPFTYHPYATANNINSIDGDQNDDGQGTETHYHTTGEGNNVTLSYQEALVEAIIDAVNDLDNVIYEISNEDTGSTEDNNWQIHMIDHIQTYEATKDKQHLIGRTVSYPNGDNAVCDASGADWVSYSSGKADAVHAATDPVSMYDTDHTVGLTDTYAWMWTSFCEGHGGAWYMDEWDGASYGEDRRETAEYVLIRDNLGYLSTLTRLLKDLLGMTPQAALSSSGFCLAKDHATAGEYVCYYSGSGTFDLNLSTATGTLNIRWLRCSDGTVQDSATVSGGATRTLTPPWTGNVVAYVRHL